MKRRSSVHASNEAIQINRSNADEELESTLLNYRFGAPASLHGENSKSVSPVGGFSSNSNSNDVSIKRRKLNSSSSSSSNGGSRTTSPTGSNLNFSNYLKYVSADSTFYSNCIRNRRESIDVASLIEFHSKKLETQKNDSNFGFNEFQGIPKTQPFAEGFVSKSTSTEASRIFDKSMLRRNSIISYAQVAKLEASSRSSDKYFVSTLQREHFRHAHFGKDFFVAFGNNKFGQCLQLDQFEEVHIPILIPSEYYQHESIRQIICRHDATFMLTEDGKVFVGGNLQNGTFYKTFGFNLETDQVGCKMISLNAEELFQGQPISKIFCEGDEEGSYLVLLSKQGKLFNGGRVERYEDTFQVDKIEHAANKSHFVRSKIGIVEFDDLHLRFIKDAYFSEQVFLLAMSKCNTLEEYQKLCTMESTDENTELFHYGRLIVGDHHELMKLPVPLQQVKKIDASFGAIILLTKQGQVYVLGENFYGELGLTNYSESTNSLDTESTNSCNSSTVNSLLSDAEEWTLLPQSNFLDEPVVEMNCKLATYITASGKVFVCGADWSRCLGLDTKFFHLPVMDGVLRYCPIITMIPPSYFDNKKIVSVFCSNYRRFFVTEHSEIYACGNNVFQCLGLTMSKEVDKPSKINFKDAFLKNITSDNRYNWKIADISSGNSHTIIQCKFSNTIPSFLYNLMHILRKNRFCDVQFVF